MTVGDFMGKNDFLNQFQVSENELVQFCNQKGVKALYIFGSVLGPRFHAGKSDLDFLVEFNNPSFDAFFELLENLKVLFKYENIDLVTVDSLKNRVIRNQVLASRKVLYAA